MKIKSTLFISTLLCISCFISCIQDEAPNAEADILTCYVPDLDKDYRSGSEIINISPSSREVNIWVIPGTIKNLPKEIQLSPEFTVTEGATILPESGSKITFKRDSVINGDGRTYTYNYKYNYTVTSQDRKYHKDYIVQLREAFTFKVGEDNKRTFNFENSYIYDGGGGVVSQYHVFYDIFNGEKDYIWESANAGYATVHGAAPVEDYPTYNAENGYNGKCVRLRTSLVGSLGARLKMPMAAGNFFVGTFDKANAMKSALTSTKFGVITYRNPISFDFYYKFKRGEKFTDEELHVIDNELDYPDAYAVLFKPKIGNDGNAILLDGTTILPDKDAVINLPSKDKVIVAVAKWDNKSVINEDNIENAEFHHVSIPFEFVEPYNSINYTELKEGRYYLTIVFTSSYKGDYFYGAEGSTLYIDEATVTFEPKTEN